MFEQHFPEALHEGAQPLIRHIRDEIVMHTALAKKGNGYAAWRCWPSSVGHSPGPRLPPEEAQQDHGKGVEQPQAVAARGRADANPAHAHAKAQVLGIPKTALDAPAFGVVVNESPRAFGGARSQTPGFLHVLGLHAHHGTHPVMIGGHMSSAQDACTSRFSDPLCRCPHLALRIGDVDVAAKANDIVKLELVLQQMIELLISKTTVGHDQHPNPLGQYLREAHQHPVFVGVAMLFQSPLIDREPQKRCGAPMGYKILHRTYYNFSAAVRLEPHALRLRPREDHELRIESSTLEITPPASLRWHRDVEDNSVAIATFDSPANQLLIESEVIIQQYNEVPLDFLVADYATDYPFTYTPEDRVVLSPYMNFVEHTTRDRLTEWVANLWQLGERLQTYALLQRLCVHIHQTLSYHLREEPGVQTAAETLSCGTGSCRDFAYLFMEAVRRLGLASRFVSGYLHAPPSTVNSGATHAWAEVYLPGAGWKGFDPTIGEIVGTNHIAVAVARLPESVPPQ